MPYKRLSRFSRHLASPKFWVFGNKLEFFNTHGILQQLWTLNVQGAIISEMKSLAFIVLALLIATSASAMITDPTCGGVLHGIATDSANVPVSGIQVVLEPIGVDLGYVLPRTVTNNFGEYWFDHVCAGRFTVVVDDEAAGYPPSFWSYFLDNVQEVQLTAEDLQFELPVIVPEKAASVTIIARDRRTEAAIHVFEIRLSTSKASRITVNHDSSEPLLLPANIDIWCRLIAHGYRQWPDKRTMKHFRLAPSDHTALDVELEPSQ